jgi:hypothetical protein
MQSLKFKQLLLISNSTKSANQFDFQKNLTIITAGDNNYGKSTLGKLLYWSCGCDPDFDTNWLNQDCRTILKFSVGNTDYEIMRYKSMICLNTGEEKTYYSKTTGEFSERIAKIFGFHALLPGRSTEMLEVPPPAYYFVPFYIDQKKSWTGAWEGFGPLAQYANWKSTIIKYHIGLLPKEHFELELKKSVKKFERSQLDIAVKKLEVTLETVDDYISEPIATLDEVKLREMTDEIRNDLSSLSDFQEKTLDTYAKLEGERSFLFHQKNIAERIVISLEQDYEYAVEHFTEDEIECPLCGTHHQNSVVNRASILTDKQQAIYQHEELSKTLKDVNSKLESIKINLEKTRTDISEIHAKYFIDEETQKFSLNDIIENIAGNAIKANVEKRKDTMIVSMKQLKDEIKQIALDQNSLLTEEQKSDINELFLTTFTSYIDLLNADDINTSAINNAMDYNKIIKEGGAAEGSRGILAYYLTIHSMIEKSGNDVLAPLLIDTPNQQEQSKTNYNKILELIKTKVSSTSQIILCALQNENLDVLKEDAQIIHLDENKLFSFEKFEAVSKEFQKYRLDYIDE